MPNECDWPASGGPVITGYNHNDLCIMVRDLIAQHGVGTRAYMVSQFEICEPIDPRGFGRMWRDALDLYDDAAKAVRRPKLKLVASSDKPVPKD